ncbi:MAG: hypothetical protein AB1742_10375 [bacterium]
MRRDRRLRLTKRVFLTLFILSLALAPRVHMLFTVDRYTDADESIVGLMAMHVARGEPPPVFFYGQHYGGGHVIEALAAAPLFRWFGASAAFVQAVPALFSAGVVLIVFFLVSRTSGGGAGFLCALAVCFSTPFLKSSLKADGYVETVFLGIAALYFHHRMRAAGGGREGGAWACLLGLALGLAWWSYDFGLAYLAALALASALERNFPSFRRVLIIALFFIAGASPLIYDNLTSDFANVRHLLNGMEYGAPFAAHFYGSLKAFAGHDFAAFLTRDSVHNFAGEVPPAARVYAFLALAGFAVSFAGRRSLALPLSFHVTPVVFAILYLSSPFSGVSPRYLLPLEPFLSAGAAAAAALLLSSRRAFAKLLGTAALAALAAVLASGAASVFNDDSITEGNVKTDPRSLIRAIDFLDSRNLNCVYTTYFIKWRLIFESRERITALDVLSEQKPESYLRYETAGCDPGASFAFVFHRESPYTVSVLSGLRGEGANYLIHYTTDHMIIYPARAVSR